MGRSKRDKQTTHERIVGVAAKRFRERGLEGIGVAETWDDAERFRAALAASGAWSQRRREQARAALWSEIDDSLLERFRGAAAVARHLAAVERAVIAGTQTPSAAARALLAAFLGDDSAE